MTTTRPPRWTPPRPTPQSRPRPQPQPTEQRRPFLAVVPVRRLFGAETGDYFLLLGVTLFLVAFGLVMVLSASSVESYTSDGGWFGQFQSQGLYALIGVPLMLVASRMRPAFWKRWSWPAVLLGGALQLLVFTPLGFGYGGNNNWIALGSVSMQPSEFVKLALIVWISWVLVRKQSLLDDWKHLLLPVGPVALGAIGLVLAGKDLGTAIIMILIVLACLYFGGAKLRILAVVAAVIAIFGVMFAYTSQSRADRIRVWIEGCTAADYQGLCWQIQHGIWALASGGWFGQGLGNSSTKWNWLPEASNDFIFAIIGEELGLIGAGVVIALFVVMAFAFVRIIRSTHDDYARIVTGGVMVWIIGQAFVNIAVVLRLLPVLGVPLPFISSGGSALIATLLAVGVVLSFARRTDVERHEVAPARQRVRSRE